MIVKPSARVRIQYKTSFFFFRYLLDALFDVYQDGRYLFISSYFYEYRIVSKNFNIAHL